MEIFEATPDTPEYKQMEHDDLKKKFDAVLVDLKLLQSNHEKLQGLHDKYSKILRHLASEHNGLYFICGEVGNRDGQGLPDGILVCPAYGLDGFCLYKKDERGYTAPEW
jgi:hypothetical protein